MVFVSQSEISSRLVLARLVTIGAAAAPPGVVAGAPAVPAAEAAGWGRASDRGMPNNNPNSQPEAVHAAANSKPRARTRNPHANPLSIPAAIPAMTAPRPKGKKWLVNQSE